jgi:phosphoglycolate phosphatase
MNIVFDLDGTLIDSAPDIQSVATAILSELGKEGLSLTETRSFVGEGASVFVSRMMAVRGLDKATVSHAEIYQDFLAKYALAVDKAVFYPGVLAALSVLKASGHRLGLCTNKPEVPARAVMRHMGLDAMFHAFIAGGMLDSRKPEPEMLWKTIEQLGVGGTLFVGDSEIDAETARRAGVRFALFSEGYRKKPVSDLPHDWVFDHFDRLQAIVAEAGKITAP